MNFKIFLFTTSIALSSGSCGKKYLELRNPNQQEAVTFWQNQDDATKAVNAIYQSFYYDGTFMRFAQCALDLRGDDVITGARLLLSKSNAAQSRVD